MKSSTNKSNAQAKPLKSFPERQCLGCGAKKQKKELLRVVKSPEGEVSLDFTGRKAGRGAYICKDAKCLAKAMKSKKLDKSLSCEIPEDVYDTMRKELENENSK